MAGRPSTFAALKHREFRLLWIGLGTSGAGDSMQSFGLGWLVVQLAIRDGVPQLAPLYIGLVGLSRAVPAIVFGLFGGVLADRVDRRRLLGLTQSCGSLIAIVLAALTLTDRIGLLSVMALSSLSAAAVAFDRPTRQAMLPRLVPPRDLMSAIGLNGASMNGAAMLGPLIGGVLIGPLGVGGLMAVNAVSYLATIVALVVMRPLPLLAPVPPRNVLQSMGDGFAFVRHDPVLRWVIGLSALMSLGARPFTDLMPAIAHDTLHVGVVELSWLLGAAGAGNLAGSVAAASLGGVRRRGLVLAANVTGVGAALVLFSLQRSLPAALVLVVLPGFNHFCFSGMSYTLLQTLSPDSFRGRVVSIYSTTVQGFTPLGTLLLGSLGSVVGISPAIGISGTVVGIVGLYVLTSVRPLREFRAEVGAAPRVPSAPVR